LKNTTIVQGNHEEMFLTGDLSNCSTMARKFYEKSSKFFSRHDLLTKINAEHVDMYGWRFCHTIREDGKWLYLYDEKKITQELTTNICVGHTHYQKRMRMGAYEVVNVGSIGQNREKRGVISWGMLDTETKNIAFCEKPYNLSAFAEKLSQCGYADELVAYYRKVA
jgi:predicted phosphodiesterase